LLRVKKAVSARAKKKLTAVNTTMATMAGQNVIPPKYGNLLFAGQRKSNADRIAGDNRRTSTFAISTA
jgi:hypothetical protein